MTTTQQMPKQDSAALMKASATTQAANRYTSLRRASLVKLKDRVIQTLKST